MIHRWTSIRRARENLWERFPNTMLFLMLLEEIALLKEAWDER